MPLPFDTLEVGNNVNHGRSLLYRPVCREGVIGISLDPLPIIAKFSGSCVLRAVVLMKDVFRFNE